jgi:hypothetical protein
MALESLTGSARRQRNRAPNAEPTSTGAVALGEPTATRHAFARRGESGYGWAAVAGNAVPGPPPRARAERDRALDVARGFAVIAMITSHVGPRTALNMVTNFPYLLSAADGFVLVSGATLGLLAGRKREPEAAQRFSFEVMRRGFRLYVIHCGLTLLVLLIRQWTGRLRAPEVSELGGFPRALWNVLSLQVQPTDYMNILPLFVVFFLAAPLLLLPLQRRKTPWLLLLSSALWALAQRFPSLLPLPKPELEPISFSLLAWQFPFVLGVCLGYHRDLWIDRLRRAAGLGWWLALCVTGGMFALAQCQRRLLLPLGLSLSPEHGWLLSKETWAPLHAVYAVCIIVLGYALMRRWFEVAAPRNPTLLRLVEVPLGVLETCGKASLYCFVMHLPFALAASAFALVLRPSWQQNLFTLLALLGVYCLARWGVLAKLLKV